MAAKSSATLRRSWPPEPAPRQVIELNQNLEVEPPPRTFQLEQLPALGDHPPFSPALRDMLELNDYQVALVSRRKGDILDGARIDETSPPPPTVLLAFSWKDLVTGISAFVHDAKRKAEERISRFAEFLVDFTKVEVRRLSGEVIPMTNQEFKLLTCLLSNPHRVLSRDELLDQAWGYENYPSTRTVDTHVGKLRQKLEKDPANPMHFRTVHRVGYKFVP